MSVSLSKNNSIELPFNSDLVFSSWLQKLAEKDDALKPFIAGFNTIEFAKKLIENKTYPSHFRKVLCQSLTTQYNQIAIGEAEKKSLNALKNENTFTVTTGHQLSFAAGPLYFILKAIHTISLAKEIENKLGVSVVPIFWMADEDHDFNEINHLHFFNSKIGANDLDLNKVPTGDFNTSVFAEAIKLIEEKWGSYQQEILTEIKKIYTSTTNLTVATRQLIHFLFGRYGMLALSANDVELKKLATDLFQKEFKEQFILSQVNESSNNLVAQNIIPENKLQAKARAINFFYFDDGLRNKVEIENGNVILGNGKEFLISEFENLLKSNPENVSPNVFFRPLYQELILPNIAYIGGGAEVSYWLQLAKSFAAASIQMPMIIQRNSVLPIERKLYDKFLTLGFTAVDLLKPSGELVKIFLEKNSEDISLENQKLELTNLFVQILEQAKLVDVTLQGSVEAEKVKSIAGLNNLEQKINKAQKLKFEQQTKQIQKTSERIKPQGVLNERVDSGIQYLSRNGLYFLDQLLEISQPWGFSLKILVID
jgi:bacillithiol biosynthesis cysteine-adding enzyme BshC